MSSVLVLVVVVGVGASPGTYLVAGIHMTKWFPTIVNDYVRTGLVDVDLGDLGVVTHTSEPALCLTPAAARQGNPWFFVKVGASPPKVVWSDAYDGASFAAILDEALGR